MQITRVMSACKMFSSFLPEVQVDVVDIIEHEARSSHMNVSLQKAMDLAQVIHQGAAAAGDDELRSDCEEVIKEISAVLRR